MTPSVHQQIVIDAPRDQVWQALTNPNQIVRWFVPNLPFAEMKLDDAGKLTMHLGEMGVDFLTFDVIEAEKQATIRGLPDGVVSATYTLAEESNSTHLTIALEGVETLKAGVNEAWLAETNKAWQEVLRNLQAYLGGNELPHPQAFVGPLFGYWRDEPTTALLERSIWMAAPRERVWRAITDPQQLQLWMSPNTEWQLSALEVGGKLYVHDAESNQEKNVEVIEVLDPPHQLATRVLPDSDEAGVKEKIYTLTEEKGGTRLTLVLKGYEQESAASRAGRMEENAFGFGMMLQNIKAYLEGAELPFPWGF